MHHLKSKLERYKQAIDHIQTDHWQTANRHLVCKVLAEFSHEKIIFPKQIEPGKYSLYINDDCFYTFSAKSYWLDYLDINPDSISKTLKGELQLPDALQLILELRQLLEISDDLLPIYLDEITATLSSKAFKLSIPRPTAKELAHADFQTVEISMDEGHPVFIANNGRIGFDSCDYLEYAPECGMQQSLIWIAVHKDKTVFSCISNMTYERLIAHELAQNLIDEFNETLKKNTQSPQNYYWMPVHEWQWREKITTRFSHEIAVKNIIFLGIGYDKYITQQSIRTLFNESDSNKYYVKTALSILNMGFMRGLSPYFMSATPQINEWVENLLDKDPFFSEKGFHILREVAAIGFKDVNIENAIKADTPYKKMLSALWRESPLPKINSDQKLLSMTSLLHIDRNGNSVIGELIKSSGMSAKEWVKSYLDIYLIPLIHCFYKYDLVFMPHGENLILVLNQQNQPVSIFMKDIGEEVGLLNSPMKVPELISRISVKIEDDMKINYIFLDIFDCFFRFLVPILDRNTDFKEYDFWLLVSGMIKEYQNKFPEQAEKYKYFNLFKPEFIRTCLNRLQLNNNKQMIDLDDREKNLKFAGMLENPLNKFLYKE
ncbi:IucA/IucC family protein [Neisseria animaloris]|uniref:Aerobactin synthase IucC n=1 Tax=Neisseria animaloris TaxID=326522 RepID=A0A3S4XTX5_9NEIS|nr:IucA/IucC family siderophore biosynthesis protein [Neisseria animaloris]VEJ21839.1 Aerobactin synthase IucC [Neisseria animaloris]